MGVWNCTNQGRREEDCEAQKESMGGEVGGKSDEMQDGGRKEAGGQAARRWTKIWGGSSSVQLSERGDQGRLWAFGGPFWGSFQGLGGQRRAAAPTGCWPHSLRSGRSAQQRGRLAVAAVTTDASGGGCRPYRTKEKALGHVLVLGRASPPAVEKPSGSALEVYLVGSAVMAGTFSDPVPGHCEQYIVTQYLGAAHLLQMAAKL